MCVFLGCAMIFWPQSRGGGHRPPRHPRGSAADKNIAELQTADILNVVALATQEELVSFRSLLVCTLRRTFSMCCLYHNVLSRVTPRYTAVLQYSLI